MSSFLFITLASFLQREFVYAVNAFGKSKVLSSENCPCLFDSYCKRMDCELSPLEVCRGNSSRGVASYCKEFTR